VEGQLTNWSGCGNDLRCSSAMTRRLIIDSLVHFVTYYGVDGFRFDLAELIGVDVLREIERALKAVKPDAILIAEPWSFRGHIAAALRDTGFASWNDGYRNFLRDYVRGNGGRDSAAYFLRGSPWHFARWPAQTVNYTESHDDHTWIDVITENADFQGMTPTARDIRRTHLMIAFLMASIGVPMLAAGQDFLRSKGGVRPQRARLPAALSVSRHARVLCELDQVPPRSLGPVVPALLPPNRGLSRDVLCPGGKCPGGDLQCEQQSRPDARDVCDQSASAGRRHPSRRFCGFALATCRRPRAFFPARRGGRGFVRW
jgi:hypothetical protein